MYMTATPVGSAAVDPFCGDGVVDPGELPAFRPHR